MRRFFSSVLGFFLVMVGASLLSIRAFSIGSGGEFHPVYFAVLVLYLIATCAIMFVSVRP